MEFVPPKCYYFFIGKTYSIDNYEMTNVLNMLDHVSTNIAIQHRNLKGSGT